MGRSAQQGFEGQWAPTVLLAKWAVRVPLRQTFAQFSLSLSQQYEQPSLARTGDGKGGDTQLQLLGSFTDLSALQLARPFLLVGLSVPIGGSSC